MNMKINTINRNKYTICDFMEIRFKCTCIWFLKYGTQETDFTIFRL